MANIDIQICKVHETANVVGKTISVVTTLSGVFKEDTSVIDPVIKITMPGGISTYSNYVYIPTFNRYYFINDIVLLAGREYELHLHVDVLHTYRDAIKNCSGIVTKTSLSESLLDSLSGSGDRVIQNPGFPSGAKTEINRVEFGSNYVTNNQLPNWVLTVLG